MFGLVLYQTSIEDNPIWRWHTSGLQLTVQPRLNWSNKLYYHQVCDITPCKMTLISEEIRHVTLIQSQQMRDKTTEKDWKTTHHVSN